MLHSSTQKLIHKLCDLTASGAIAWKEDERGRVVFETEGYLVEVEADPPGVRLLHADGRELDYTGEADLAATPWPDGNGNYATRVADMARRANRVARGAEQAISKILSSLAAPPEKAAEPEPFPAALELESSEARQPPETEPPPESHSVAEAPPEATIHPPNAATAIAAVLAAEAAPRVEEAAPEGVVESPPVEPEAETTIEAAEEELPLEEAPPSEPLAAKPAPVEIPAIAAARPRAAKLFGLEKPRGLFGETQSFSRQTVQKPAPATVPPAMAKVTSTGLFITGFSATTRQTIRGEPPPPRPAPQPVPAPVAQAPEPVRRRQRETAAASAADIYKPWS